MEKEDTFQQDWKEIVRILQDTGTSYFERSDRVLALMKAIETRDLHKMLQSLKLMEQIFERRNIK
jgi:hypothetical protein